jgi:hypothetical protein
MEAQNLLLDAEERVREFERSNRLFELKVELCKAQNEEANAKQQFDCALEFDKAARQALLDVAHSAVLQAAAKLIAAEHELRDDEKVRRLMAMPKLELEPKPEPKPEPTPSNLDDARRSKRILSRDMALLERIENRRRLLIARMKARVIEANVKAELAVVEFDTNHATERLNLERTVASFKREVAEAEKKWGQLAD